jgi:hypothetical protein
MKQVHAMKRSSGRRAVVRSFHSGFRYGVLSGALLVAGVVLLVIG